MNTANCSLLKCCFHAKYVATKTSTSDDDISKNQTSYISAAEVARNSQHAFLRTNSLEFGSGLFSRGGEKQKLQRVRNTGAAKITGLDLTGSPFAFFYHWGVVHLTLYSCGESFRERICDSSLISFCAFKCLFSVSALY